MNMLNILQSILTLKIVTGIIHLSLLIKVFPKHYISLMTVWLLYIQLKDQVTLSIIITI